MAKKKKSNKKKKPEAAPKEASVFWPIAGAIFLIVCGIFLLLGMFGTGGALPKGMYSVLYSWFGYAAVLTPIAALYWGWLKFRNESRRIPLSKLSGMVILLAGAAALCHTMFVTKDSVGTYSGGNGGGAGSVIGGAFLTILDKIPASIFLMGIALFSFLWTFGISPKILLKPFERRKEGDTDLSDLKKKESDNGFKLNENVPVEHHKKGEAHHSTFKNTAQKLAPSEDHQALTTANDPNWKFPEISLLNQKQDKADAGDVEGNAETIKNTLANFNIPVEMEGANIGPTVTQYTLKPPNGVKLTRITALENNLALDLAAHSIRMEAPIPGKRLVGIEVPNLKTATVRVSSVFQANDWQRQSSPLAFAVGKDISGTAIVSDLAKLPHVLVAGQTGSGKSVMINTILTSLLYRNSPSDLKLVLVDPKMVELAPYNDIPHLLTPVITEPEKCISALKWAVAEMERRYRTLADSHKRNIDEYNSQKGLERMPYIVIVIDELADLMMMAARDVEALIVRIAQKARAVGIHLVLATQRPSVDVITGLIKANIPGRIAFTTQSQVDSRTIIDQIGAEKLLGMGDMLLLTPEMPKPKRIQGAFIGIEETHKINDFLRMQRPPEYDDEIISQPVQINGRGGVVADFGGQDADDDMYKDAVRAVIEGRKASTSLLQRRLRIGYGRAARLIETMEEQGIISSADGNRPREVLVTSMDEVFGGGSHSGSASDEVYNENFPEDSKDEYLTR